MNKLINKYFLTAIVYTQRKKERKLFTDCLIMLTDTTDQVDPPVIDRSISPLYDDPKYPTATTVEALDHAAENIMLLL